MSRFPAQNSIERNKNTVGLKWEKSKKPHDPVEAFNYALILSGVLKHKQKLLELDPFLPFPQGACCFAFGEKNLPLPIGALYILWEKCPDATGECIDCREKIYVVWFGGLLGVGWVVAICPSCGAQFWASTGGLFRSGEIFKEYLKGTPFVITRSVYGGAVKGDRKPLYDALLKVGETELPFKSWADVSVKSEVALILTLP